MNKTLCILMAVLALGAVINSKVGVAAVPQFGFNDMRPENKQAAGIYVERRSFLNRDFSKKFYREPDSARASEGAAGILDAHRRLYNGGLMKPNYDEIRKAIASDRKLTVLSGPGNVMITMNS